MEQILKQFDDLWTSRTLLATDINVTNAQLHQAVEAYNKIFNVLIGTKRQFVITYHNRIVGTEPVGIVQKQVNWHRDMHLPLQDEMSSGEGPFSYYVSEDDNITFLERFAKQFGAKRVKVYGRTIHGVMSDNAESLTKRIRRVYEKGEIAYMSIEDTKPDNVRVTVSRINKEFLGEPLSVSFYKSYMPMALFHRNEEHVEVALALIKMCVPEHIAFKLALQAKQHINKEYYESTTT